MTNVDEKEIKQIAASVGITEQQAARVIRCYRIGHSLEGQRASGPSFKAVLFWVFVVCSVVYIVGDAAQLF